jgi:hypothetical protein
MQLEEGKLPQNAACWEPLNAFNVITLACTVDLLEILKVIDIFDL